MSDHPGVRSAVGDNIRVHRTANGMTQKQLAERLGTHESHICHWERGNREPELTSVFKICIVLDCELEDILGIAPEWKQWMLWE